jgi:hypothetical protein
LTLILAVTALSAIARSRYLRGTGATSRYGPARTTPKAGDIIISPTTGDVTGHVGIIGGSLSAAVTGSDRIYSNSTALRRFSHKFTLDSWRGYYGDLGLSVLFFELNPAAFGMAVTTDIRTVISDTFIETDIGRRLVHQGTEVAVIADEPGGISFVQVLPDRIVTGRLPTNRLTPRPSA